MVTIRYLINEHKIQVIRLVAFYVRRFCINEISGYHRKEDV